MAESKETSYYRTLVLERDIKISELEKLIETKNKQIKDLNEKVGNLKVETTVKNSEENIIKKILSYYAKGYQFSLILEKLRFNAYDANLETIRRVCLNIDDLDNTYILYYKEQVEAYEKSIKINPELLKDNLMQRYQLLINDASEDLSKTDSVDEKRKLREEIRGHMRELNAVLKNIVEDNSEEATLNKEVEDIKTEIRNNTKILSIDKDRIKFV